MELRPAGSANHMNVTEFSDCLNANRYAAEVNGDLQDALKLGVSSTPTFFINGRPLVGGRSFEEFKFRIDKALTETN